jgi:hypothetical protein
MPAHNRYSLLFQNHPEIQVVFLPPAKNERGIPMQQIKINIAIMALKIVKGSAGALDKGRTINFIVLQIKIPYSTPVRNLYFKIRGILPDNQKKKKVNAMAITKWKTRPHRIMLFPPVKASVPNTPLAINFSTAKGFLFVLRKN